MMFRTNVLLGVLMVTLGIGSLIFRRVLVRWHSAIFWPRPPSPEFTRLREAVQLGVGVVLLLFGLAFLFDFL
jgi:hypothetical protein